MHNIESDLFRSIRSSQNLSKYLKDVIYGAVRWCNLHNLDRSVSQAADETWVVSPLDQLRLRQIGGADSTVIPNPLPDERMFGLQLHRGRYESPSAIFIGYLAYSPNIAAVRELVLKIWPAVRAANPEAHLTIAGRDPSELVLNLEGAQGLSLLSDPTELVPLAASHGYAFMPIRSGAGTRIKVLEAMAAGLVMIATGKAVEGLGLEPGRHYLRAETARDFVRHFGRCLKNPDMAMDVAERARRFASDKFRQGPLARLVADRLARLSARASLHMQASSG
jgi:glycosyltransferase involved in cell wall biosynthesis